MSELDDLEEMETKPTPLENGGQAQGRKNTRKYLMRAHMEAAEFRRREGNRLRLSPHTPSLPKLKFMEDPEKH